MKKIFIALLLISIAFNSNAQNKIVDSLKTVLAGTNKPIERFGLLNKIVIAGYFGVDTNIDSLTSIDMYKIAQQLHNDSLLAISYDYLGVFFLFNKNNNTSALEYFFKGLPLAEKLMIREGFLLCTWILHMPISISITRHRR